MDIKLEDLEVPITKSVVVPFGDKNYGITVLPSFESEGYFYYDISDDDTDEEAASGEVEAKDFDDAFRYVLKNFEKLIKE